MQVSINDEVDVELWDRLTQMSLFHTRSWISLLCDSYQLKPFYALCSEDDQFALIGACSVMGSYVSLPYTYISGFLWNSEYALTTLQQWLEEKGYAIRYRDICEFNSTSEMVTSIVSFDSLTVYWKSLSKKMRNQIRKSEKAGFEFLAQASVDEFYYVFSRNMHRLGTPVHARDFFRSFHERFDSARLFVVRHNGKPVAAMCGIVANDVAKHCESTFYNLWASTLEEYDKLYVNYFLYWGMFQAISEEGIRRIDLGTSITDSGVFRFKQKLLPKNFGICDYTIGSAGKRRTYKTSAVRGLVSGIWRTLPYPITLWLGPKLRKYLA